MFPNIACNGGNMVIRNGNQIITMGPDGMKIENGGESIQMNGNGISRMNSNGSNSQSQSRSHQSRTNFFNGSQGTNTNIFSGGMGMPNFNQIFSNFDQIFSNGNQGGTTNFTFSSTQNYSSPNEGNHNQEFEEEEPEEGLSREEIDNFPTRKFRKNLVKNEENNFCAICQEEYKEREKLLTLTCFHNFHKECVVDWLKKKASCPVCKYSL